MAYQLDCFWVQHFLFLPRLILLLPSLAPEQETDASFCRNEFFHLVFQIAYSMRRTNCLDLR